MKRFTIIWILGLLTTEALSQDMAVSYGMTTEQNIAWLTTIKNSDKSQQLALIQNRFFIQNSDSSDGDVPSLIVDGIPIDKSIDMELKNILTHELTADKVKIQILDTLPEGIFIEKRWTGIIMVSTDKKTRKKIDKVRSGTIAQHMETIMHVPLLFIFKLR